MIFPDLSESHFLGGKTDFTVNFQYKLSTHLTHTGPDGARLMRLPAILLAILILSSSVMTTWATD